MSKQNGGEGQREKLDFESPEDRQARLGQLLSGLSAQSSPNSTEPAFPSPPAGMGSRPYHVGESDVLARARQFLPLLASSNQDLLSRAAANPDAVNIENTDGQDQVIAMDLNLGVFDVNGDVKQNLGPEVELRSSDDNDEQGADGASSSDSSDSSSSEDDSDDEEDAQDAQEKEKDNQSAK